MKKKPAQSWSESDRRLSRSADSRLSVGKTIAEVEKRFGGAPPLLHPLEDMEVKEEGFKWAPPRMHPWHLPSRICGA